jgi:DNA-binding transcriptional regulator YiaG
MTPEQFKQAREALGYTQQGLANEFNMGANGGRTIRRWESNQCPVSPIAAYALMLMRKAPSNQVAPVKKQLKSSGADLTSIKQGV